MEDIKDLYTDYLLSSFGQVTSTGLSSVLDGSDSHDRITRHLSGGASRGKELWLSVKPFAKRHRSDEACVIFDDTIIEKPFSKADENNCYHYDHSKGRNVKGINLLNCLYHSESEQGHVRVPINYHLVSKSLHYCEIATKKEKRKSEVTKNELFRDMVGQIVQNQLPFRYVLADSWFCSNDNMRFIQKKGKYFICGQVARKFVEGKGQPYIPFDIGICQTGKAEAGPRHQPFCHEGEGISGGGQGRLQGTEQD